MDADVPSLDQLRSNAAECIRLAEAARTSEHKSLFIEMAERWLTLAEHAAREGRLSGGFLFRDSGESGAGPIQPLRPAISAPPVILQSAFDFVDLADLKHRALELS
jgi:hypothetical protein